MLNTAYTHAKYPPSCENNKIFISICFPVGIGGGVFVTIFHSHSKCYSNINSTTMTENTIAPLTGGAGDTDL